MNLTIVLADAELELAPEARNGRSPFAEVPVLDAYFHRDFLRSMPGGDRRGRPDIVHMALSLCQGSRLNRRGGLKVFVHTREDKVISVDPGKRIPPNYIAFLEEMTILLGGEQVDGYSIADMRLVTLIGVLRADMVIALTPDGEDKGIRRVLKERAPDNAVVIVGAFPRGDYASPVYDLAGVRISLGPDLLTVPTVISEVLSAMPLDDPKQGA
ncbi:MAG: hypothetical protein ISF22_09560 [Methanomassiliicoccus sp.]|nr:hypothetical protein [Methanomassiliicoccus sp.]